MPPTNPLDELLFGGKKADGWFAGTWTNAPSAGLDEAFRGLKGSFSPDAPRLLDIEDVRDAFKLMNPDRIQPKHTVTPLGAHSNGYPAVVGQAINQCLYSDPKTGRPSCIAGTVISILAPDYFAEIKADLTGLKTLLGLKGRFTQRAIDLLFRMQEYADGALAVGRQRTWGEAFREAALDQLSGL